MIIEMPNTRTREIAHKIEQLHEERGESATGRVLTLLISTTEDELEQALELANAASREHPCRVIAISPRRGNGARKPVEGAPKPAEDADAAYDNSNLDAQVRFGADAGAGEIIVLHPRGGLVHHPDTLVIPLLVPDAPVVAWWPNEAPANPSKDLLGAMARSRITDAMHSSNPYRTIEDLRRNWSPKNVDMAWTRLTVWRAMLATMLDQPPHLPISTVKVSGPKGFLPMDLLAAWLRLKLNVPVIMEEVPGGIRALAHITGGGITENLNRALPASVNAEVDLGTWPIPPVVRFACDQANLSEEEALKTFNMGIGMVLAVSKEKAGEIASYINEKTEDTACILGEIVKGEGVILA